MTNESILVAVNSWARERQLKCTAKILPEPPSILDMRDQPLTFGITLPPRPEAGHLEPIKVTGALDGIPKNATPSKIHSDHSGVYVVINEPEETEYEQVSMSAWLHASGIGCCSIIGAEWDKEATPQWLHNTSSGNHNEEDILRRLGYEVTKYYERFVLVPALKSWLEKNKLTYQIRLFAIFSGLVGV